MKDAWENIAEYLKQLRKQAKKAWDSLTGSPVPKVTNSKETTMNNKWNRIAGQWTQYQSKAKQEWSELTDSELMAVNGRFEVLTNKIQERYGIEREEARQQIDRWTANLRI